ncbi:hypothetical protein L4D76_01620 [Photobacterium sagamiensis]|uniref:DUF4297 family anti-phage-associated protein n=1 Tax=Photobacterium sagamiensis TaxID=2910241 RepID=UPI003D0A7F00
MTSRAANATIKGYLYQFDYSVLKILETRDDNESFVIEGTEDIDIHDETTSKHVQCKYYEATEYNHSVIKDAVVAMLTDYHERSEDDRNTRSYHIYGFYSSGQSKLPDSIDTEFVKTNFLTSKKRQKKEDKDKGNKEVVIKTHEVLGITDNTIDSFIRALEINVKAASYESQQNSIYENLKLINDRSCDHEIETIYYPRALSIITDLAKNKSETERTITKKEFLSKLPKKEIVFNQWLIHKIEQEKYNKAIKRQHFTFKRTNIPKETRIFSIDINNEFKLGDTVTLLKSISDRFSNVEHQRTTNDHRFCPFVLIKGVGENELKSIKQSLYKSKLLFSDGFPFKDSDFIVNHLMQNSTKENKFRLKFIPSELTLKEINDLSESVVKVYDFYKETPIDNSFIPEDFDYKAIRIESAYSITEMIQ